MLMESARWRRLQSTEARAILVRFSILLLSPPPRCRVQEVPDPGMIDRFPYPRKPARLAKFPTICHLDKGSPVSALPPEVSGGTIRSHPPDEPPCPAYAHPTTMNKLSTPAWRSFMFAVYH